MTEATVLIPTFDHGPTLAYAVGSALSQTVDDIEIFIVGDGVPDATREIVTDISKRDPRVRFFDNPKGPRHGEIHRHAALKEAKGRIVCYLSDDDLWLPGHVELMIRLLDDHDFVCAPAIFILPGGEIAGLAVDLGLPFYRHLILSGTNRIPLSCGAHTLRLYRQLPYGWRTTPVGVHTDLYMWQQILSQPNARTATSHVPTVLHLSTVDRPGWSIDERVGELETWTKRIAEPSWESWFYRAVIAYLSGDFARTEVAAHSHLSHATSLESQLAEQISLTGRLKEELQSVNDELLTTVQSKQELEQKISRMEATITRKLRAALLKAPILGRAIRWAVRGRSLQEAVAEEEG